MKPEWKPPLKTCPQCYGIHFSVKRICTFCNHEFYPPRKPAK